MMKQPEEWQDEDAEPEEVVREFEYITFCWFHPNGDKVEQPVQMPDVEDCSCYEPKTPKTD